MLIVHVFIHVKDEYIHAFKEQTLKNVSQSIHEPGIVRFDFIQEKDNASRFLLLEIYRTPQDPAAHKETDHYKEWRAVVEPMMAEPRKSIQYIAISPDEKGWEYK